MTTESLFKSIKQGFLKTWPGLTKNIIKKQLEKLTNNKMLHLHMRRQGLQSTREKTPDTDLEYKSKKNVVFWATMDPSTTKEGGVFTKIYAYASPSY